DDVGDPAASRAEGLDLADEVARTELQGASRPLHADRPLDDQAQRVAWVAGAHDRLAVLERRLLADREDRLEELVRQRGEHARVADDALVATAVEEQRRPLAVAHVLDLTQEERVV